MRLQDRQIVDQGLIDSILKDSHVLHLALNDGDFPYVVPTNYGYKMNEDGKLSVFFHGAPQGKKFDLLKANDKVGFEIDDGGALMPSKSAEASDNSYWYRSIIGYGQAVQLMTRDEKMMALQTLLVHETGHEWSQIDRQTLDFVSVFRIVVENYTVKGHIEPKL
ncbi:pyridoxamine 5'-phosphate oxidase family protein [Furfurilactobacillus rossiae]|uniref:5-nitroimidazole antibiotic resistance n=1 Tax=Furfurilactobacillus rossiae DSM 15814 TaxID=1114972 RepID=A0A0R1RJF7_9LACO|nr:pyridoxamine 5'-phosphate oxidase family protein [Furfurilactobacillus rossiae]KRL57023.1 5-nitroimidazole antibiotic resistance [Furfurilactobacillus rossiae DSM 15814]QFR66083.1 pyridoxamine 5'-phosphate oxidase family protein [Furfurilactobacillus rossiae]QLE61508.1 Pyridoxamine 5'-phosphate oxidase-related FMN-binding [Furfurilactobacillus rossiae]